MGRSSLLVAVAALLVAAACAELKLQQVDRKINLNSQFARVTEQIKLKNTGGNVEDRVVLCSANGDRIAFHKVTQVAGTKTVLKVSPTKPADAPAGVSCVEAQLADKLPAGEVVSLENFMVLADVQTPFPKEVSQGEQQLMVFKDNVYVVSPYQVSQQSTEVVLPSSTIKSYTDTEKPVSKSDNKVTYGKYDLIKPFTISGMRVHYESSKSFKKVTTLVREIEVSHWGNIYVEESYEIKNDGAKHTGSFSRLKYAHTYNGKGNSFREMRARFPASAHSLYYVDLIGNISSSDTRKSLQETVLDFELRYPLLGGWKVDFKLGYSVPLTDFLFKKRSDGKHRLTMPFSTPLEDVFVEDMIVRVVLPEGSHAIESIVQHAVEKSADVKYTYLDVSGRPVVVLHMKNVVPEHASKFHVDYAFSSMSMLREPLLLITAFAALFVAAIVYNRLEFTISKDDKWQEAQKAEKLTTVMQQISAVIDEQESILDSVAKLTASLRTADDGDHVARERSQLEASLNALDTKLKPLIVTVEAGSAKIAASLAAVLEKGKALQARYLKQLSERLDLAKKGVSNLEATKRLAPTQQQLLEAKRQFDAQLEALFEPF
mmetsp:Transcript_5675/g.12553  ORF Transcript_5675/g.12553 Transcript_5675/m.12553 type:complete len:602 (+) Transcript_5675:38-1843(+)|eukprot:CAMPEP_0202901694 /NCGR_PEP_ID=MMETSP1392-20130828/14405_1 /ASSEMBLY_ACC=CAM_ASM_000868 /TAXON_ID=225041 /ORGANISM="Chlamydomonas chlamydogama, Strain SAG 11-48b" /LENGTH=601 /DNA_ID=CAMNT_0049588303 /DNA_START=15 /DNA_END=1820 /DNA_ORIENTATION=+